MADNALIDRLRKRAREWSSRPRDTLDWKAADQIAATQAENVELRRKLEDLSVVLDPFAAKARQFSAQPDGMVTIQMDFAHFRRALTAISTDSKEQVQ